MIQKKRLKDIILLIFLILSIKKIEINKCDNKQSIINSDASNIEHIKTLKKYLDDISKIVKKEYSIKFKDLNREIIIIEKDCNKEPTTAEFMLGPFGAISGFINECRIEKRITNLSNKIEAALESIIKKDQKKDDFSHNLEDSLKNIKKMIESLKNN